jgi:hypothetical protein
LWTHLADGTAELPQLPPRLLAVERHVPGEDAPDQRRRLGRAGRRRALARLGRGRQDLHHRGRGELLEVPDRAVLELVLLQLGARPLAADVGLAPADGDGARGRVTPLWFGRIVTS